MANKREKAVERPPRFLRPRRNLQLHLCHSPCRILLFLPHSQGQTLGRKDRAESALMEKVGSMGGVCQSDGVACIFVPSTSIYPAFAVLAAIRARNDIARLTNEFVLVAKLKRIGFRFTECRASGVFANSLTTANVFSTRVQKFAIVHVITIQREH